MEVKEWPPEVDRWTVTEYPAADRRAASAHLRAPNRVGFARRLGAALRAGLYRPLAGDDDRVERRRIVPGLLLDELRREELPRRAVAAGREVVPESLAEVAEPPLCRQRRERRPPREGTPKRR